MEFPTFNQMLRAAEDLYEDYFTSASSEPYRLSPQTVAQLCFPDGMEPPPGNPPERGAQIEANLFYCAQDLIRQGEYQPARSIFRSLASWSSIPEIRTVAVRDFRGSLGWHAEIPGTEGAACGATWGENLSDEDRAGNALDYGVWAALGTLTNLLNPVALIGMGVFHAARKIPEDHPGSPHDPCNIDWNFDHRGLFMRHFEEE